MKYYFTSFLLLLLTFHFLSCKKDKNPTPSSAPLMGSWEIRSSSPALGPYATFDPGNGSMWTFSSGDHFKNIHRGQTLDSGAFQLSSAIAPYDGERKNLIRFNNGSTRTIFTIINDTLTLSSYPYGDNGEMLMDGGSATYVRIKD
ncbi:hypothetical protein ACTJJ0_06625 [Chitinophaga sp. 22321]|uniref:Lipocalin-like domain-containing protein n=1 Tax=Chitinophaga hostae TaxID=2831022 RepID=A0ABS5IYV9_9BACT|nr:hypothetical protein [Chitinophaga hostae]MBS0028065.1 hypothetical protein [Chitinophaga hostae]